MPITQAAQAQLEAQDSNDRNYGDDNGSQNDNKTASPVPEGLDLDPDDIPQIDHARTPNHWANRTDPFTYPRSMVLSSLQLSIPEKSSVFERFKTTHAIIAMCLNIGVDPPDCFKPAICAQLEAWVDPYHLPDPPTSITDPQAINRWARSLIGNSIHAQYLSLQNKLDVQVMLDPTSEGIKRKCEQTRQSVRGRILFHYNGHGVPRPTPNGDIWAFDNAHEQYIPVNVNLIYKKIGSPTMFIWDCSNAQAIVEAAEKAAKHRRRHAEAAATVANSYMPPRSTGSNISGVASASNPQPSTYPEDVHFAATRHDEILPTNPDVPADLFTACLTTPIRMALRFWVAQNPNLCDISMETAEKLPGSTNDRRTPLGELNWIFVTITDTIAWSVLPRDTFYRLFRQDVMLSTMFRNYLLADRIMRFYNCHPTCSPQLPPTHKHPLWETWDMEVETCLRQLPKLLKSDKRRQRRHIAQRKWEQRQRWIEQQSISKTHSKQVSSDEQIFKPHQKMDKGSWYVSTSSDESSSDEDVGGSEGEYQYEHSPYFNDQLCAFKIWLHHARLAVISHLKSTVSGGKPRSLSLEPPPDLESPEELPVVLQVILSQAYRYRALTLFYEFLCLGPWAVDRAAAVNIINYIAKLLDSSSYEIKDVLIMICARLVAVDPSFQHNLGKDNYNYFIRYLFDALPSLLVQACFNAQSPPSPHSA